MDNLKEKAQHAIEHLKEKYQEVRAGRANPAILNKVMVMYYETLTPISQVAGISVPEAKVILIQPWDLTILKALEKALIEANLGITPQNDGKVIRLVFPDLTNERRKELAKEIKEMAEASKVAIRNIRRDVLDSYKDQLKNKEISEDDLKRAEANVQKEVDAYIKEIDSLYDAKEKEIMTV